MKNYVITGGTSGIGRSTATELAKRGERVVLLGRNSDNGRRITSNLRKRFGNPEISFLSVDLANFNEVRKVASEIRKVCPVVDVLINNAGARYDRFQKNGDGYEMSFAGNHLGHFLLTSLLLEPLKGAEAGRIVVVSSVAHRRVESPVTWIDDSESFERWSAYSKSKLANTIFAFDLADRLKDAGICCNAVDPGLVASNFARNNGLLPWGKHLLWAFRNRVLRSPGTAAAEITEVASSEKFSGVTGKYLSENEAIDPSELVRDSDLARELWALSLQCVGLEEEEIGPVDSSNGKPVVNRGN